jgi:type VI secretion system protein ImpA
MSSPEVLDFAKLLAPIAGVKPAGTDLRANRGPSSPYDKLKDARTAARTAERALRVPPGDDVDAKNAQRDAMRVTQEKWPIVRELAPQVIAEQAKDLEVTAWLIEALVRTRTGYAGLRDGFRLARELAEQFWDGLYPQPDEDGLATRVAPLTGLNGDEAEGTLLVPIKSVPLTEKQDDHLVTCLTFQQAHELESLDESKRAQRVQQGAVSLQVLKTAVTESSAEFFINLIDDIKQCRDEFDKLNGVLQDKCGTHAPPSSDIRNALESCLETVQDLAKDKIAAAVPAGSADATAAGGSAGAAAGTIAVGAIRNREDAFRNLLQVAEYFRRNEPHTPISYALEQVVRWGKMSLPELLAELIPEDSARSNLFKWVGIKPPDSTN